MNKIYLPWMCTLCLWAGSASAAGYKSLTLYHVDGTKTSVTIEENMTTKVAEGNLCLESSKGYIFLPMAEIMRYTFSTQLGDKEWTTGVDDLKSDEVSILYIGNQLILDNLPMSSHVSVTALDGRVVTASYCEGRCELTLEGLTPGIYIVKCNNRSLKFSVSR